MDAPLTWLLELIGGDAPGAGGTALAILVAVVVFRIVILPITILHLRAIRANRRLSAVLRGVRDEGKSRQDLEQLYRASAHPLKDPILALAVQAPFLIVLYFAVRDFSRDAGHWDFATRSSLSGLLLAMAIISVSLTAARDLNAHVDDPIGRGGAMMGPMMMGVVFMMHPFVAGWALAFFLNATADLIQEKIMLRGMPSPSTRPEIARTWDASRGPLLACRDVQVAYDGVQVLFGVDLEIFEGEIIALLGTNGAGKSTLLRAVSGLVDPMGGSIWFEGRDITHLEAVESTRLGIVQIPGGRGVFPTLTVDENLRAAAWLYRQDRRYVSEATRSVQEMFPILAERPSELAGNMSGGEQQMLSLAMAFLAKPKLLLIDELSLGLAPAVVEQLLKIVRAIHAQGTAIVLVEQSVNIALTLATRAYFMEKGEVRFSGEAGDLLGRTDLLRSVFLRGAGSITDGENGEASRPDGDLVPREAVGDDVVLEVRELTKRFGGIRAVGDVSFVLNRGEILGLIGPNGSGKTTILDLISGFQALDKGRVLLDGKDITGWSPNRRAMAGLGRSFQDARIFPSLTVAENLATALERHLDVRDHVAAALHLPDVRDLEEDIAWTVNDLVALMGLEPYRDKLAADLSTGTRRIVDLAMSVAHDPTVLTLDEPSSGISQRETEALGQVLRRIQSETGCSILLIEHDMPLICGISDRMIALETGSIIAEGAPADVVAHPRVVESYLGTDANAIQRSDGSEVGKPRGRSTVPAKAGD
ncbi:MAG: ATP-binding cassette domain-containing protein [Actinomycetota bacterium]